jgi:hypothetical protein
MNSKGKVNSLWTFEMMILHLSCKQNERCAPKYVIFMLSLNKESKNMMYLNFLNIRNFDSLNFKMP